MMDGGIFYAFLGWTGIVATCGFLWGNHGFESDLAKECDSRNEMVISGTVYQCKPIALVVKGHRAELPK